MTDEDLIMGIKKRNEAALDCLINQYGSLIKSIVYYHINNTYKEECINDILLSIWNNISKFNPEKNSLKNWIGAVCKYKCIDYNRKYYRENFSEIDENIPSPYTAEQSILKKEIEAQAEELLNTLPPKDREIFKRRYIDEEPINEIAQNMNISLSVIYNRISRGRKKLKKSILRSEQNEK